MAISSKCDFSIHDQMLARRIKPIMLSSSKCDFSVISDGLSVFRDGLGRAAKLEFDDRPGSIGSRSSKCDWSIRAEDFAGRFKLDARVTASSKCDFSVLIDFGLANGDRFRAIAAGSSKCDFQINSLDKLVNPSGKRKGR